MLKKVILAIEKPDENMRREEEELKVRLTKEGIETEEIRGKENGGEKIGGGEDAAVCITAVSYTHLDVYKRQRWICIWISPGGRWRAGQESFRKN